MPYWEILESDNVKRNAILRDLNMPELKPGDVNDLGGFFDYMYENRKLRKE